MLAHYYFWFNYNWIFSPVMDDLKFHSFNWAVLKLQTRFSHNCVFRISRISKTIWSNYLKSIGNTKHMKTYEKLPNFHFHNAKPKKNLNFPSFFHKCLKIVFWMKLWVQVKIGIFKVYWTWSSFDLLLVKILENPWIPVRYSI